MFCSSPLAGEGDWTCFRKVERESGLSFLFFELGGA